MEKNEIINKIKNALLKEEKIIFAYIYGSILEGEIFNDIDIAVYLNEKFVEEIDIIDFEISLGLKIGKIVNSNIDIKILNSAPISFKYQVSCGILLFSHDELKRENFLCQTWSEYFDFLPVAKLYLKEVLSG